MRAMSPLPSSICGGTPYYTPLIYALRRYSAEQNLFPLEVALDLSYWRDIWKEITKLSKKDRVQALHIVGSELDANNLMWAIRYRVYHKLSEEEVINYTLPFGYRVRDLDIRAIAAGEDIGQVVGKVYPDLTNVNELLQNPQTGLPELEVEFHRTIREQCWAAFVGYPFQVGVFLGFLTLKKMEVQDLTALIEAKSSKSLPRGCGPSYSCRYPINKQAVSRRAKLPGAADRPGDAMFFPQIMTQVRLFIPARDLMAVTKDLADQRVFHQADGSALVSDQALTANRIGLKKPPLLPTWNGASSRLCNPGN